MSDTTFKFTKERLLAVAMPSKKGSRVTVRDTEVAGLELRVTSTGAKSFSWFRRVKNGQPERVTIGGFPELSVLQARTEATKLNAVRVDGHSPATERRVRRQELRFGELFERYIGQYAKLHKKTWAEDRQRYTQYLAGTLGGLRLKDVTRAVISKVHADITISGHPAVANRVLALASTVLGRAVEWSLLDTNPAHGIRRNKEQARDRFLGSEELPRFFRAVLSEPNETVRDFFLMLLFTGARRANVLSMAWSDINMDAAVWRIPMTKNGDPQNVTLSAPALEVLGRMRQLGLGSPFVFPGVGAKGHLVDPKKAWLRMFDRDEFFQIMDLIEAAGGKLNEPIDAKTGEASTEAIDAQLARAKTEAQRLGNKCQGLRLEAMRIHDLRRTLGSWQAITGAPLNIIGKSLNHKNLATTAIYARLNMDPVRASVDKATEAMLAAGRPIAQVKTPS